MKIQEIKILLNELAERILPVLERENSRTAVAEKLAELYLEHGRDIIERLATADVECSREGFIMAAVCGVDLAIQQVRSEIG